MACLADVLWLLWASGSLFHASPRWLPSCPFPPLSLSSFLFPNSLLPPLLSLLFSFSFPPHIYLTTPYLLLSPNTLLPLSLSSHSLSLPSNFHHAIPQLLLVPNSSFHSLPFSHLASLASPYLYLLFPFPITILQPLTHSL